MCFKVHLMYGGIAGRDINTTSLNDQSAVIKMTKKIFSTVHAFLAQGHDNIRPLYTGEADFLRRQNHFTDGRSSEHGNIILIFLRRFESG